MKIVNPEGRQMDELMNESLNGCYCNVEADNYSMSYNATGQAHSCICGCAPPAQDKYGYNSSANHSNGYW